MDRIESIYEIFIGFSLERKCQTNAWASILLNLSMSIRDNFDFQLNERTKVLSCINFPLTFRFKDVESYLVKDLLKVK